MFDRKYLSGWLRGFALLLMIALLMPGGSAFAQTSPSKKSAALEANLTPLAENTTFHSNVAPAAATNLIQDSSFEAYTPNPYWAEFDSIFGTPLCTGDDCGLWFEAHPRSGNAWAWFGGAQAPLHQSSLSQVVTIPSCGTATLGFYFWIGYAQPGSGTDDQFSVTIDNTVLFSANATQIGSYSSYTPVNINLNAYADGAAHTIQFSSSNISHDVGFNLDDVALMWDTTCPSISGNAGVAGVTLSYVDGTPKAVTSGMDGSYSLPVTPSWSGTVTPSHPCYTFTPASRHHTNVTAPLAGQNFTPTFTPTAACEVTAGVFRPSNGALYLKNSNVTGYADVQINYGLGGDYPVVGDWDGDGDDTIGIYRNGAFYLRNSNTIGFADIQFPFGAPGDQPVAGDWNGDGVDTIGIYRNGTFFLRNSNSAGMPDLVFGLGIPGDVGIAGDWNGDGIETTGVFRPSNGALYLKNSNTTGFADIQINYGIAGDKPVTGDWDGNGTDTIGIYRNGQFFLRNSNTIGFADIVFALGIPGDHPIAGNWDGLP